MWDKGGEGHSDPGGGRQAACSSRVHLGVSVRDFIRLGIPAGQATNMR